MDENEIGREVVDSSIMVHRELGPGLMESVYEMALFHELTSRGMNAGKQVAVPVQYKKNHISIGFRADIIINGLVILELKSVEQVQRVHYKQLLTYLRLNNSKLGFLLNSGAPLMKEGITRIVNNL